MRNDISDLIVVQRILSGKPCNLTHYGLIDGSTEVVLNEDMRWVTTLSKHVTVTNNGRLNSQLRRKENMEKPLVILNMMF